MKTVLPLLILSLTFRCGLADERIERALQRAPLYEGRVYRDRVHPRWLPEGKAFWYRVETGPRQHEYVLVDAENGTRTTAAELQALGLAQPEPLRTSQLQIKFQRTARTGESSAIRFSNQTDAEVNVFWINPNGMPVPYGTLPADSEHEQPTYDGHVWLIVGAAGQPLAVLEAQAVVTTLVIDGPGTLTESRLPGAPRPSSRSPDGKWSASIEEGRVMLRDEQDGSTIHLQTDRDTHAPFGGRIAWAPDSSAFVVSSTPEVTPRQVTIIEAAPEDQLQPRLKQFTYAKPGDPLPQPVPVIFRISPDGDTWQALDNEKFANAFSQGELAITWSPDSSEFYFDFNQRGHQLYRVLAANAETGAVRVLVEETSSTFIDYTNKTWRHWLPETGELLWMSERDGWCHLYLYDVATGQLKNRVTEGPWPVREVLHVDAERREIWLLASGLREGEDPYHLHLCRVAFDGTGFRQLTDGDGQHHIELSPDRQYFVDTWSRVDLPPLSELRRGSDGSLVCVLERADSTELSGSGWTVPERFVAKGRDGETDIYGILIKPADFDPAKSYPVLENIYAGPHSAHVPKSFGSLAGHHAIADLGFIVVQIDGLGTNHRGKRFHDYCWKNLKDAGFPDRVAWIKAAASTRPWMDIERVGIYGGSAGGQNAMRALLDHHDFYRVAVADCGCHDNRMDKLWWNEQWMGWPVDDSYAQSSNARDAQRLEGQLLLIVGELDTNVDPASTLQVVASLQKAGKSFTFMPIMGAGHGAAETPYGQRLRMEFFLRHLQP